MDKMIARFTEQIAEAQTIGENINLKIDSDKINNIYIVGLGGSGIGGNFTHEFVSAHIQLPITVGKSYSVPAFIDTDTLGIVSSYSGNTEETIEAFHHLLEKGAQIVVISSGGQLIELAKENGLDYVQVPSNWDSPRACLGYSIIQQLYILQKLGFTPKTLTAELKSTITLIDSHQEQIKAEAKKIAKAIVDKLPVIYITDRMESIAIRLRQQINENAKMLCWHHVIPEMNHNELVGWRDYNENLAVLIFRNDDDYDRIQKRIEINEKIFSKCTDTVIEIWSKGETLIERSFYLVNLGDWLSYYLSELREIDSIEVEVIDYLKGKLAES